ncbi:monovalent cation/H(+) antiporter subunit G [uncultured Corynebacterium sp.]|uniref:monovalent cation/H(+) antiporter subunit G n=1 Tax=uncultured Corynebacterium sp. TaxID=159447 RepID=UPI0025D958A4|nr:monovalent cation/H(+) antiporter subunit G [uncultured Corynebacterium sp.]
MNVLSLILILTGSALVLAAAVGIGRFRDTLSRIHAVTKPQTIGLLLCLAGAVLRVVASPDFSPAQRSDMGFIVLLVLFTTLTSPVTGQRMAHTARREGLYDDDTKR